MARPRKRRGGVENLYATTDRRTGKIYYAYRHPVTGRRHGMGTDKKAAEKAARRLNTTLMSASQDSESLERRVLTGRSQSISDLVEAYKAKLRIRTDNRGNPIAEKTIREYSRMADAAGEAWAGRTTAEITRLDVTTHLDALPDRSYNAHRAVLRQMFALAVAKGHRDDNPVEGTLTRTNVVERQRLTLEEFRAIRKIAPHWFANAMDLSLITLQARAEVAAMRFDDEREPGILYVDRAKVARHEAGHIAIRIGDELRAAISRCRDNLVSPFMVHRRPYKQRREYIDALEHWTQVRPENLTRTFKDLRDKAGVGEKLPASQRPTFHEIRSLGADRYREQGMDEAAIQRLLGHTTEAMTRKYLDRRGREVRYTEAESG